MTGKYIPMPADTSDVEIPAELMPLIEKMAKNVHDVWAKNRRPCLTVNMLLDS